MQIDCACTASSKNILERGCEDLLQLSDLDKYALEVREGDFFSLGVGKKDNC